MKKTIALGGSILAMIFLAGCGQKPISQVQPNVTIPAVQTPAQTQVQQPRQSAGIVYKNIEYGFQITLPEEYKDFKVAEEKIQKDYTGGFYVKAWTISIKTASKDYTANGYFEPSFTVYVADVSIWDKTKDCQSADWREGACYEKKNLLGRNDKFVFYYLPSQDRSEYGKKIMDSFLFSEKINEVFKLN